MYLHTSTVTFNFSGTDYLIMSYVVDVQEHVHYHILTLAGEDFLVVGND